MCGILRCKVLPDWFWETPFWRESIKWPLQTLFWGFVSLHSALAGAIRVAECEIRFIKSLLLRNFPQTGPVHQCWNALLSLSFPKCMRPHFSELFRRKLNGKSARRVSRAWQWQDLCTSSSQWNNSRCAAVADSWCCRFEPIPCAAASLLPLGRDSKHPQVSPCPPGCVVELFNQSCVC